MKPNYDPDENMRRILTNDIDKHLEALKIKFNNPETDKKTCTEILGSISWLEKLKEETNQSKIKLL